MRTKLVAHDVGFVMEHCQSPEPLGTHVVIAFLECETTAIGAGVEIREVKEAPHVEGLADRTQLLHERVIETGEVFVLQRAHDRVSNRYCAGFDRIISKFSAFDQNLRKDCERVFDEPTTWLFEMRSDERVVDLMQRA